MQIVQILEIHFDQIGDDEIQNYHIYGETSLIELSGEESSDD